MSHWLHLVPALLMWSLPSPSVAQTANYTTLTMFFTVNTTVHSTPRASSSSSANESTTSNQTEASPTNATSPLDDFSAGDSQMPPGSEGALTTLPAGQTETSATGKESTLRSAGPTSKPRPTPHGTEEGLPSTTPSRTLGGSSPTRAETSAGTTWETRRLSCEPSSVSGQDNPKTEKKGQFGKTLGIFIGLAVVLLLVFGLVYLIYNRTQKDDPFSHQRLYNSDPVLSLDVTVEPPDRFYGSLTPDPGREGQGHHVMSQKALNQPKEEMKKPASPPQTHDEIQLKPMSESSVKIFL
ncbi:sialidase-like isoform X1 [Stegostoma tigrinum]|uniref:sialidase-like isoform X1 n=1 Tax=Stegostoma tigrinum TaxID=3053191 RepID=UPI00202AE640|nr:sialidase-like isoform X1 [Stegostoma tigrinum]XP_048377486.1 sialidase-like isoform X1 [Stegostoma tigrinum]XP_048377487.1 sialidase-like isoform X1 [Stegostoma tigrinum]XP_059496601.1 sialidase-like isoform X1 [Stegostoma tigrinum]